MSNAELVGAAVVCVTAAVCAVIVAGVGRAGLGVRRFVRAVAVALVVASLGAALEVADGLGLVGARVAGLHDLAFFAAGVIVGGALVRHPDLGPERRRARILVDATISGLSLTVILWLVAGRAYLERSGSPLDAMALVLAVSAGYAITRTGVAVTLARDERTSAEATAAVMTVAFAVCSLGGLLHLMDHAYSTAPWTALVGYLVLACGMALIGVAAQMMRSGPRRFEIDLPRRSVANLIELGPIVVAAVAAVAILIDGAANGTFDETATAIMTVAICAVLLRQSLTLSDNRELSASLRSTVDGLEQQATHDALTTLPNRYGLDSRIATATRLAAGSGGVCAVYFVDVDHLKSVNDSLGHRAGDLLIRATADRLTARVGPRVTRFGGDEFVVVVENLASPGAAEELGRRIVDDMGRPIALEGHQVRSSSSVGLTMGGPTVPPDELLRQADVALYRAKSLGRRCVATYRVEDDTSLGDNVDLEPELRRAVARDEFTLHYQPIIDLQTGMVASVESLLRWQHPVRGLLGPQSFLDAATSTGLMGVIGESSLRRACADFASLDPERTPHSPPSVAVNLSTSELADRRVVDRVAAALADSGLPPSRLTLEITEDVIVDETVRATIDDLCSLGIALAVDDFGTGNSSLRQLGSYPAGVLKVDKSFVDRLEDDERARAITSAIVRLARNLGLITVAEGVETVGQAELLARLGCDRAQGWLYARAMPFDELGIWCDTNCPVARYPESRANVASASSMMRVSNSATGGRSSIAPTT